MEWTGENTHEHVAQTSQQRFQVGGTWGEVREPPTRYLGDCM